MDTSQPRAAAFEPRIDGVVSFDVCYDFFEVTRPAVALARDPAAPGNLFAAAHHEFEMDVRGANPRRSS